MSQGLMKDLRVSVSSVKGLRCSVAKSVVL